MDRRVPPGPRGFPIVGNLLDLGSNPHQSLHELSKRYGDLMYLKLGSTPLIAASSEEAATAILKTFNSDFANRPEKMGATTAVLVDNENNIAMSSQWPILRKLCISHLLTPKSLLKWQQFREEEMGLLLASIFKLRATSPVNVGDFVNVFTSNVIGQMTLRMRLFDDNDAEAAHFKLLLEEYLAEDAGFRVGNFLPFLDWIGLGSSLHRAKSLKERLDGFLVSKIEQKKPGEDNDDTVKDLMQILYELKSKGELQLSDANIKGILLNMIVAGTDTATVTMEWAMSELIRHPHLMKKVREEVDSIVGMEERVSETHLPRLKFVEAVVTETLRLHPPTPLMLPHASPNSPRRVMGYFVPPNSHVIVNVWAVARDPNTWEKPLQFDPHRFVDNPASLNGTDFRIIPFVQGEECARVIIWAFVWYNLHLQVLFMHLIGRFHLVNLPKMWTWRRDM